MDLFVCETLNESPVLSKRNQLRKSTRKSSTEDGLKEKAILIEEKKKLRKSKKRSSKLNGLLVDPEYSDFFRECKVFLRKLTDFEIDEALGKSALSVEQEPSTSVNTSDNNNLNTTYDIIEEEPKSIITKSLIRSPNANNRRVTFNETSVFIDNFNTSTPTKFFSHHKKIDIPTSISKTKLFIKTPITTPFKNVASILSTGKDVDRNLTKRNSSQKKAVRKMPDFTKMHQKMYDKMLDIREYKEQKLQRAKVLLSGCKPNSNKKTDRRQGSSSVKKKEVHKKLRFSGPQTPKNLDTSKRANKSLTRRREQELSVRNKSHTVGDTRENVKTEIKGIRTNRRFELLMKFRKSQQL